LEYHRTGATSMPKLALAIRHVHFEDCGTLTEVLLERNFTIRYIDVGRHRLDTIDVAPADLLIGLGGPVSVYNYARYPWIKHELALFERALDLGKPCLGICLGAQMLAHVLGARVYPGPAKELGWSPLKLTAQGHTSVVAPLDGASTSMLHWHGDTFDLPADASLLASTELVTNQIFQWRSALAFQCHPEVRTEDIERWLIGHACEIEAKRGPTVDQLREDTLRFAPTLARQTAQVFNDWMTQAGFPSPVRPQLP
jgi:GMP synthase (glutamine-hydrolysing)